MPRFVATIIVLDLLAAGGLAHLYLNVSPQRGTTIFIFLLLLFLVLTLSLSLPTAYLARLKEPKYTSDREIYRIWLRKSALLATIVTGSLALRAVGGYSRLNVIILVTFAVLLEIYLSSTK